MVKKRGVVWNYYNKKIEGTTVTAFCKFCHRSYIQNATRMEKHLARCDKATPDVKTLFLRVSTSKRVNRARLMGAKFQEAWAKRNEALAQLDISALTEADIEDIDEWNRQKAIPDDDQAQNMAYNSEDCEDDPAWEGSRNDDSRAGNHHNQGRPVDPLYQAHTVVDVQEHKVHLRKPDELENASETIHQPTSSGTGLAPNVVHDADSTLSLQTRILHEQLSEKRALRKIAELELQRKTLELERFQWEFERDRARSEETWAHESRLMQMKEEREQRLLQESCSYDTK